METIRITPIKCRVDKLSERTTSNIDQVHSSSGPRVDRINMYFNFAEVMRKWSHDRVLIGTPVVQRCIVNYVHIIHPQVIDSVSIHETIETELSGWGLPDGLLRELTQKVIDKTLHLLQSVPQNNVLDVIVQVIIREDHFMGVRQSGSGMVPATESSIKSLKRKRIMDCEDRSCGRCPICLEEFSSVDEAVCMPCSHEFCGCCIEKWLRTSHNCPMCRYEMPTN